MMRLFSNFSASWPALAENRKYGRMNKAGARLVYSATVRSPRPMWKATSITSALRNALSLNAPRAWVQKNGAKRRVRSSWNWLMRGSCAASPVLAPIVPGCCGAACRRGVARLQQRDVGHAGELRLELRQQGQPVRAHARVLGIDQDALEERIDRSLQPGQPGQHRGIVARLQGYGRLLPRRRQRGGEP